MTRRRFFLDSEATATQKFYQILVITGVGITLVGVFTTCYLAIIESARAPFEAWISGKIFF
ncbi:hypothetical protein [Synechococcus sp. M16CYN]|uniref:hypothetical protein n=1 Tax=Synechococcus sp. M16CYN TaxID=3103139 RepID=UPI0032455007